MSGAEPTRETFASFLDALHVGVALWRLEDPADAASLRLEWANEAIGAVTGVDLRARVGATLFEVSPSTPHDRAEMYAEVARSGRPGQRVVLTGGGDPRVTAGRFLVAAVPVAEQRVAVVVEAAEHDGEEAREIGALSIFLDSIIENIPAMVFVKDATDLRFRRFNKVGEALLGIERSSLLGRSDYDLFPAEQADAFTAKDREVLRGREVVDIHEEPIQTAGGERWLHTKKIPVLGEDGEPRYLLGISYDITSERQTREALKRAHDELEQRVADRTAELAATNEALRRQILDRERTEAALRDAEDRFRQAQKMEAVGRLAGGIAHDFNNLLSVVISYASMLEDDLDETDRRRADVEQIRLAGERAAALTGQLLAFSRQQMLAPKIVDLGHIVGHITPMIARLIGEDIELVARLPPALDPVRVDPNQIEQVIMNLVVNARDAMPKGGTLTIETQNVVLGEGSPGTAASGPVGPHVMLAISDTGAGIPPETQARIFEPFFTTKEVGKGTGLGLSTVLGIVQQSGGTIDVHSTVGKGTRFEIFFPRAVGSPEAEAPRPRVATGRETILLVEDEDQVRMLAKTVLTRLGYHVRAASGATEALAILREEPRLDLLLTDVVMQGRGGLELAREVLRERPGTRVVFMSGYTSDTVVRHGVFEDRVAFIQKPITPEILAATVRKALDG